MAFWQFMTLLIVVNSAIWAHFDAAKLRDGFHIGVGPRGWPPHRWSAMVFLLWPVAFPLYLTERRRAELQESRGGPPPRFVVGGLDGFAIGVGLVGLGWFIVLLIQGHLMASVLGLVIAVAGVFGGRRCRITAETDRVELGELGFDQKGFALAVSDLDEDGEAPPPADIEKYFSNLARPSAPSPSAPETPSPPPTAAAPPIAAPAPLPAAHREAPADLPAGVPYDPPPGMPYDPPAGAPAGPPPADSAFATMKLPPPVQVAGPRSEANTAPPAQPAQPPPPPPPAPRPPRASSPPPVAAEKVITARPAPPPARAVSARRQGPTASGRRAATAPPLSGYAAAAKSGPSKGLRLVLGLGALALTAGAGWIGWTLWSTPTTTSSPQVAPLDADRPAEPATPDRQAAVPDSGPPTATPSPSTGSATIIERSVIQPWLADYNGAMEPVGRAVDEIDFGGFSTQRCQALRDAIRRASALAACPDAEIEGLFRPAFDSFLGAWNGCRSGDETIWSSQLVAGKEHIYRAQVIMDQRYGYAGVLELESEGAIGVERSPESISGRYLLDAEPDGFALPGDSDGAGFDDDGFEDGDFEDGAFDDTGFPEDELDEGFDDPFPEDEGGGDDAEIG